MKSKNKRHITIIEIVKNNDIKTQDELSVKLREMGYNATQATVSRDIKELRLIKTLMPDENYKYAIPGNNELDLAIVSSKAQNILNDCVLSIQTAQNFVIVKCYSGMAQAACAAIDLMVNQSIIGTLAGEDTIFIATKTAEVAIELMKDLQGYLI